MFVLREHSSARPLWAAALDSDRDTSRWAYALDVVVQGVAALKPENRQLFLAPLRWMPDEPNPERVRRRKVMMIPQIREIVKRQPDGVRARK